MAKYKVRKVHKGDVISLPNIKELLNASNELILSERSKDFNAIANFMSKRFPGTLEVINA